MSKSSWSEIPRGARIAGVIALLVVAGLATKMGLDFVELQENGQAISTRVATPGAGDAAVEPRTPVVIAGFRSARFGDDAAAVRKAIETDFGVASDKITEGASQLEKTKLLAIRVKDIVPESGIGEVVYILGYTSKKLIQVNVVWSSQLSPDFTPQQFGATATILGNYFARQGFDPKTISVNQRLPNGVVRVFNGKDLEGHLVTLVFQEGELKVTPDEKASEAEKEKAAAATRKVAAVRLSYVENAENPDVLKIEKGKF
tara:strand:- start:6025 stop:6801 length:777 start_codon:yes stop_codon:yes gene_type:complete